MKAYTPYITTMAAILPHVLGSPLNARENSKMVYSFSDVSWSTDCYDENCTKTYEQLTASPSLVWSPCYRNL